MLEIFEVVYWENLARIILLINSLEHSNSQMLSHRQKQANTTTYFLTPPLLSATSSWSWLWYVHITKQGPAPPKSAACTMDFRRSGVSTGLVASLFSRLAHESEDCSVPWLPGWSNCLCKRWQGQDSDSALAASQRHCALCLHEDQVNLYLGQWRNREDLAGALHCTRAVPYCPCTHFRAWGLESTLTVSPPTTILLCP